MPGEAILNSEHLKSTNTFWRLGLCLFSRWGS